MQKKIKLLSWFVLATFSLQSVVFAAPDLALGFLHAPATLISIKIPQSIATIEEVYWANKYEARGTSYESGSSKVQVNESTGIISRPAPRAPRSESGSSKVQVNESTGIISRPAPRAPRSESTGIISYPVPRTSHSDKTIILIQDAHTNESGQINIAKIIESVLAQRPMQFVFTEAAQGDHSLNDLKELASQNKREAVGLSYLRKGYLQGTAYASLVGEHDFTLWGVEDMDLYRDSVKIYQQVVEERSKILSYLSQVERTVNSLKAALYNEDLQLFDKTYADYTKGAISLTDYFGILRHSAQAQSISLQNFPHLNFLAELKRVENDINFDQANREQAQALKSLSIEDQQTLTDSNQAQKHAPTKLTAKDNLTTQAFFKLLEDKLNGRMKDFPQLKKYTRYLDQAQQIDAKSLLTEQAVLEKLVFEALAHTQDELLLGIFSKSVAHLKDLFELKLTPEEFRQLESQSAEYDMDVISGFLNKKIAESMKNYEQAIFFDQNYTKMVEVAKSFYQLTYQRDIAFVENMLSQMELSNQKTSMLVAGGFHTQHLKELFKQKGISYIAITPNVLHETNHARYENLLLSQLPYLANSIQLAQPSDAGISLVRNTIGILQPDELILPSTRESVYSAMRLDLAGETSRMSGQRGKTKSNKRQDIQAAIRAVKQQIKILKRKIERLPDSDDMDASNLKERLQRMQEDLVRLNTNLRNMRSRMASRHRKNNERNREKIRADISRVVRKIDDLRQKQTAETSRNPDSPSILQWEKQIKRLITQRQGLTRRLQNEGRSRMTDRSREIKDLDWAIKQIGESVDRGSSEFLLDEMSPTHAFKTAYQELVETTAIGGGVYKASFDERQLYIAEAFPSGKFKKLNKVLATLKKEKLLIDSKEPADYMRLMRRFESLKYIGGLKINEAKLLRLALEISLGIYEHEGRVLELQNYKEQLELELAQPGQGKFHKIAAIQDIHGSAHRLAALVGYAFGLKDRPDDLVFDRVAKKEGQTNLQALEAALGEANIDPSQVDVTIVGLADKWDRGKDPAGVFEIVSWLTSIGKAEPLVGNHDIWRANGVLRLHDYYAKGGVDYRDDLNKGRHLAYWAWDAINHEGWSVVEFEQENEKFFNDEVDRVNKAFARKNINDWVPLERISLDNIRAEKEGTILRRAKDVNAGIRKENNAMANKAIEQHKTDHAGDADFKELEGEALEKYLIEHVNEFPTHPEKPLPDIAGPVNDSLIKRMQGYNQTIRLAAEAADESVDPIVLDAITKDNYYKNDVIVRRALWDLKHYHLARIDELRNLHLHNLWAQGDDGFDVDYKTDAGIKLRGVPALQAISEKIIRFFEKYSVDELLHELTSQGEELTFTKHVIDELGRELTLVNAVYADKGGGATMIAYQKFIGNAGIDGKVGQGIGVQIDEFDGPAEHRLFWGDILTGHIDSKKWLKDSIAPNYPSPISGKSVRNVDGGMSFAYHRGGFVALYDPTQGLRLYGYLSEDGSVADVIDDQTLHFLKQLDPKQQYLLKRNHNARAHQHERLQAILEALSYEADQLAKELETINKVRSDKYATISEVSDENVRALVGKYKEKLVLNAIDNQRWSKAQKLIEENEVSLVTLAPLLRELLEASRLADADTKEIETSLGTLERSGVEEGLRTSELNLGGLLRQVAPEGEDLVDVELFAAEAYRVLHSDDAETFSFLSRDSEALYTVTVEGAGDGAELVLSFGENLAPYTFNKASALEKLARLRADEKQRIEELVYAAAAQSEARQMAKEHLDGARAWALDYQIALDDLFAKLSDAEKVVHLNLFLASAEWSLRQAWGKNNQFYLSQAMYDNLPLSAQRAFNNASVLNDYRIKVGDPDGSHLIVNGYTQGTAGKKDHFNLRLQAIRKGQIPQYLKMIVMPHIVLQDTLVIQPQVENDTLQQAFAQAKQISAETYAIIAKGWQSAPSQNVLLPGLQYIEGFQFTNQQVLKLFLLPVSQWLRAARMGAQQLAVAA